MNGLEQVHSAGFLHRDIKPANILLDGQDRPTLIDFGASRAAVAGRSQAMTAVFTPGYAAVEQFTAAAQGPSTDIYGLAATLHHAITGQAPPNAIDRILDDTYVPLAGGNRPFPRELLAGIDAGLAVRAADRPQSIAAWRTALSPPTSAAGAALATVVMRGAPSVATTVAASGTASRKRPALMLAAGVAVICALAGGWFVLSPRPSAPPASAQVLATVPAPPAKDRAQEELEQARREQKAALEEAARLRTEAETRRKADEEVALRRKIEEEMRQKAEADEAARRHAAEEAKRQVEAQAAAQRQAEEEAKSKAEAEAAARLKAEEADLKGAEAAEVALRLTQPDRQRIQVALTALGFVTGGSDGVFGAALARDDRFLAEEEWPCGHRLRFGRHADSPAARGRAGARPLRRGAEEAGRDASDACTGAGFVGEGSRPVRRHIPFGMVPRRLSGLSAKLLACADDGQEWCDLR